MPDTVMTDEERLKKAYPFASCEWDEYHELGGTWRIWENGSSNATSLGTGPTKESAWHDAVVNEELI